MTSEHTTGKPDSATQPPSPSDVAARIRLACEPARVRPGAWRRSLLASDDSLTCAFCLSPLQTKSGDTFQSFLVPLFFGAPASDDNRILACRACIESRGSQDVFSWPAFARLGTPDSRADLLARREQILFVSDNHLTPTSRWMSMERVRQCLLSRFRHPRARVFAIPGFIGWTHRCGGRSALSGLAAILRFGFQAQPVPGHRCTLFASWRP